MSFEKYMPSPLKPAVSAQVHLSLTITFTALYGLLFILILWQLFLILYYKHRRLSYQTIFLFTCLIWAALRTTLFSFYFKNVGLSNLLGPFEHWLLFALPVYLQYLMLCILVFYFLLVVVKNVAPMKMKVLRRQIFLCIFLSNVIFLVANITSSLYGFYHGKTHLHQVITIIRVCIDYSLFMIGALALCYCIIKLTKLNTAKFTLQGQGVSYCQAITVCAVIALLYITRGAYNILAVSPIKLPTFGYGWINVSDQGESGKGGFHFSTENYAFISFGCVLFVWELLPTFTIVWFFRVRRPEGRLSISTSKSDSYRAKYYFFDNPNRYDSDDDLNIPFTPPNNRSLLDIPSYGTVDSSSPRSSTEYSTFRKTVNTYGSVPAYNNSYNTSIDSTQSPQGQGATPPTLHPRISATINPYRATVDRSSLSDN